MKTLTSALAIICILLGTVWMLSPFPGGIFLIAGGLTLLICTSPSAQYCLMWVRSRVTWVNKSVLWMEAKVGSRITFIGEALGRTHPPGDGSKLSHRAFVDANLMNDLKEEKWDSCQTEFD